MMIKHAALIGVLLISSAAGANSTAALNGFMRPIDGLSFTSDGKISVDFTVSPWNLNHDEAGNTYTRKGASTRSGQNYDLIVTASKPNKGHQDFMMLERTHGDHKADFTSDIMTFSRTRGGQIESMSDCTRSVDGTECFTITYDYCRHVLKSSGAKSLDELSDKIDRCAAAEDAVLNFAPGVDFQEAEDVALEHLNRVSKTWDQKIGGLANFSFERSSNRIKAQRGVKTDKTAYILRALVTKCKNAFSDELNAPQASVPAAAPKPATKAASPAK